MDWHILTHVHSFIGLKGSLSSSKWISFAFLIDSLFKFSNDGFLDDIDVGHETLYSISRNNLESYIYVPLWHVVREWTVKSFPEFLGFELLQVCINDENNETSVEELTKESTFDDLTFLSRYGIFTNP